MRPRTLGDGTGLTGFWLRFAGGFVAGFVLWFPIIGHQVLRKVVLPLALPDIVNSLRLIFGLAFGYIMLAEVINAKARARFDHHHQPAPAARGNTSISALSSSACWHGASTAESWLLQRHLFPHLKNAEA